MIHAASERQHYLRGSGNGPTWRPTLLVREQTPASGNRSRPVLYVHGATFPSALSVMFRFDGVSWADRLNEAGFVAFGLDFAGYGGSERYPPWEEGVGEPLGRAADAAAQIERAVRFIQAETGAPRVSLIAHSWGTIAAGLFATQRPELVERMVMFGPIVRREGPVPGTALGPWRQVTVADQHARFVEDVPAGHPPVLLEHEFPRWAETYLASDPSSGERSPPSVRIPSGPAADIRAAWSGHLAYDPALIHSPVAVVRGAWDSLCTDADAAWLTAALATSPEVRDVKVPAATHLMHLESAREALYRTTNDFLAAEG